VSVAGDPLDVDVLTLLDQALSVVDQLDGVEGARAALRTFGDDPDALRSALQADIAAAEAGWARRQRALARRSVARAAARDVVTRCIAWFTQLRRVLAVISLSADHHVAVHAVRSALPRQVRTLNETTATFAAVRAAIATVSLADQPGWTALLTEVPSLAADLHAADARVRRANLDANAASAERTATVAALRTRLRDVRARWKVAATLPGVPPLDLRIGRSAVASRAAPRAEPCVDPPAATVEPPLATPHPATPTVDPALSSADPTATTAATPPGPTADPTTPPPGCASE
jgi:hypothetical protein